MQHNRVHAAAEHPEATRRRLDATISDSPHLAGCIVDQLDALDIGPTTHQQVVLSPIIAAQSVLAAQVEERPHLRQNEAALSVLVSRAACRQ